MATEHAKPGDTIEITGSRHEYLLGQKFVVIECPYGRGFRETEEGLA